MADNKQGRDDQAHDAANRRQERAVQEELERMHETEPPIPERALDDIEAELEPLAFPATGRDVVEAVGDRVVESASDTLRIGALLPETDIERFDSPRDVRERVQRPTVAAAMKRIVEAAGMLPDGEFRASQRDAYLKTFHALKDIDADDDDEGLTVISEWVVDEIEADRTLPGSRAVRRQAAEYCRSNGYQVSNNDWLGI